MATFVDAIALSELCLFESASVRLPRQYAGTSLSCLFRAPAATNGQTRPTGERFGFMVFIQNVSDVRSLRLFRRFILLLKMQDHLAALAASSFRHRSLLVLRAHNLFQDKYFQNVVALHCPGECLTNRLCTRIVRAYEREWKELQREHFFA